jgi:hypothetical protein
LRFYSNFFTSCSLLFIPSLPLLGCYQNTRLNPRRNNGDIRAPLASEHPLLCLAGWCSAVDFKHALA